MQLWHSSTILSLTVVLGCSACAAGDTNSKAMPIHEFSGETVLIVGIEAADHTDLTSDITFHVDNTSDTAVNMLIWNTPLERELSADIFSVTFDDVPQAYLGRMVKRSTPGEKDYLRIAPQERVEIVVDLADYYEMSRPGEYQVSLTLLNIDGQNYLNQETPVRLDTVALAIEVL